MGIAGALQALPWVAAAGLLLWLIIILRRDARNRVKISLLEGNNKALEHALENKREAQNEAGNLSRDELIDRVRDGAGHQ